MAPDWGQKNLCVCVCAQPCLLWVVNMQIKQLKFIQTHVTRVYFYTHTDRNICGVDTQTGPISVSASSEWKQTQQKLD